VVLPAGIFSVATLLPLWLLLARLPEPLASSWNSRGQAASAVPAVAQLLFNTLFSAIPLLGMCKLAFRRHASRGEISVPVGVAVFASGMFAVVNWLTIQTNLHVATWKQLGLPGLGLILLSIGVFAALGAAAPRFSRALETAPNVIEISLLSAGLMPGARAVWVGTARSPWARFMTIMILASILLALPRGIGPWQVVMAVLLLFTSIRVTVDRNSVRIAYGLLGWPVQRVRLSQIRQASMLEVKRIPWGFWIYNGSLRLLRRAAIVVREGQGVRLELEGGRTLDIAVDDAEQAAGVINDLVAANHGVARQSMVKEPARLGPA